MKFKKELGFITTPERSDLMKKIRSTGTRTEIIFRKVFWVNGLRYRVNYKKLPGSPDIVFMKYRLCVFVDGEFWHGYNWDEKKKKIKTNRGFWIPKIERNMARDLENNKALTEMGFTIIRFWEHQIKKDLSGCVSKVLELIKK